MKSMRPKVVLSLCTMLFCSWYVPGIDQSSELAAVSVTPYRNVFHQATASTIGACAVVMLAHMRSLGSMLQSQLFNLLLGPLAMTIVDQSARSISSITIDLLSALDNGHAAANELPLLLRGVQSAAAYSCADAVILSCRLKLLPRSQSLQR